MKTILFTAFLIFASHAVAGWPELKLTSHMSDLESFSWMQGDASFVLIDPLDFIVATQNGQTIHRPITSILYLGPPDLHLGRVSAQIILLSGSDKVAVYRVQKLGGFAELLHSSKTSKVSAFDGQGRRSIVEREIAIYHAHGAFEIRLKDRDSHGVEYFNPQKSAALRYAELPAGFDRKKYENCSTAISSTASSL
jgi:hypothetical protein